MKAERKHMITRVKVLSLLAVYLFVTLSYIFFLASITVTPDHTNSKYFTSSLKNPHSKKYVQRTDKAVFKENNKSLTKYFQLPGSDNPFIAEYAIANLPLRVSGVKTLSSPEDLHILYQNLRI